MNLFIITGTSSGLGLELAQQILDDDANNYVLGISRRRAITHTRYTHVRLDLCNLNAVMDLEFPITGKEDAVYLINNAGWLGEVAPMGSGLLDHDAIHESFNINLVAPTILINQFISQVKDLHCRRVIVNISSGAGKYPIKSWSTYCASKAGLDMLTRVVNEERPEIETYAIAPGIVDTPMQKVIREAKPEYFPDHQRFVGYFENGDLRPAEEVARQIIDLLKSPSLIAEKVFSLRDIEKSS
jgi:benzil reductase ((S)-benzoin forming)